MEDMNNKDCKLATIPFIAYEAAMDRAERRMQRQSKMITYLVILLAGSNLCWIILWSLIK